MAVAGHLSPFLFCGCFAVLALAAASIRPYSLNILLEQQGRDAGTASALMNCMHAALGCIGMLLAMLPVVKLHRWRGRAGDRVRSRGARRLDGASAFARPARLRERRRAVSPL